MPKKEDESFIEKVKSWLNMMGILILILFVIAAKLSTCTSRFDGYHEDYDSSVHGMIRPN